VNVGNGGGRRIGKRSAFPVLTLVILLAIAGCSTDTAVKAAQAKVTVKQSALVDAQAAATEASATFCSASATYITALDRYGDVLAKTEPTVGDVTTAGKDLKRPQTQAVDAGQAAVAAQQELAKAEQDLAKAQADLAAAQGSASGGTASPTSSPSATSSSSAGPDEAVTRVQQAEAEFATAQRGITDATPLRQASQQFNAAAVALEMAWLQLYAEAGCLTDAQQAKAQEAVHDYTIALQQELADAGYYKGAVDGVYGPETVAAIEALQKAHGLPVTGTMDKASEAALQSDLAAAGGATAQATVASTAAVQQTLKLAGYWDGPVDGQWTPALTDALKKFQTDLGVPATGTVDAATIAALEHAIATQPSPTATPSPSASSTPTSGSPTPSTSVS
jgi:peptidoglycan hydrolase-like protein with peptidoglycan-binding domain